MADISIVEISQQRTIAVDGPGGAEAILVTGTPEHVLTVSTTGLQGPSGPQGASGPPGTAGPPGEQGPPGVGNQATYAFASPSAVWLASHNISTLPSIIAVDTNGDVIQGDVSYPTNTQVRIEWAFPMAGVLTLTS
jgi:hypothetical protein